MRSKIRSKCRIRTQPIDMDLEFFSALSALFQPDEALETMMREAHVVVAAWGPLAKLPSHLRGRWREVAAIADRVGSTLMCFGTTQDGQPRHTLMLPYSAPLVEWVRP